MKTRTRYSVVISPPGMEPMEIRLKVTSQRSALLAQGSIFESMAKKGTPATVTLIEWTPVILRELRAAK